MILRRRQARLSLIEQADWISEESPETADPFIDAAAASFSFLESNPVIFAPRGDPRRPRQWPGRAA
jgi:hypothetical protein